MDTFVNVDDPRDAFLLMLHDRVVSMETKLTDLSVFMKDKVSSTVPLKEKLAKFIFVLHVKKTPYQIMNQTPYDHKQFMKKCMQVMKQFCASDITIALIWNTSSDEVFMHVECADVQDVNRLFGDFVSHEEINGYIDREYSSYVQEFTNKYFEDLHLFGRVSVWAIVHWSGETFYDRLDKPSTRRFSRVHTVIDSMFDSAILQPPTLDDDSEDEYGDMGEAEHIQWGG